MRQLVVLAACIASLQSCCSTHPNSRLNFFDIDLLRYAVDDKPGNVMVSPVSIRSILAMLLEGAEGDTAHEIITALRLSPNRDDYRRELEQFVKAFEANTSNVIINNANGLFVTNKIKLNNEYEVDAKKLYLTDIIKLNFDDPKTAAYTINKWVNDKTKGLIPSIVDQVHTTPSTQMILTNALYFKSPWLNAFEPKLTHGDCFYKNGICKTVAMMELDAELKYAFVKNLRAHALELPYQDDRYSMLLLVPQDHDAGVALIRDLPYIGLPHIYDLMEPADVILSMPKFTVEYGQDMVEALKNMHITTLFSPNANLSGIFNGKKPYIDSIFHTAHMTVDETGTVAAAASAAMVIPLINNQVQLRIDRPFLFFIRDKHLDLVLFEGKIEEPMEFSDKIKTGKDKTPVTSTPKITPKQPASQPIAKTPRTTRKYDYQRSFQKDVEISWYY